MVTIRAENLSDVTKREALLNAAFGVKRFRKTSEKLRRGRLSAEGLAFSAVDAQGKLIGTVRLWDIIAGSAGGQPCCWGRSRFMARRKAKVWARR